MGIILEPDKGRKDAEELATFAVKNGAKEAKVMEANKVVVDERVQMKCRYPPCNNYGKNLMCPPYTMSAKEFREIVGKYKYAIALQREVPINDELKAMITGDTSFIDLNKSAEYHAIIEKEKEIVGKEMGTLISAIERKAFLKGYYLSLGLAMLGDGCNLCPVCELKYPCKHPWEARPSMEALGIDVTRTMKNAGLQLLWGSKDIMTLNGLILIG